jgi:hypothetical protein
MKPGFQIVTGAYSAYVTRVIWKGIRSRFHFGMGTSHLLAHDTRLIMRSKKARTGVYE